MQIIPKIPARLIALLVLIAVTRPLLSAVGAYESIGATGPLAMTALISIAWIGIGLFTRISQPVLTMTIAGVIYGLFAIGAAVIYQLFGSNIDPANRAPIAMLLTFGLVSVLLTNAIWGAVLGCTTWGAQRALKALSTHDKS